MERKIIFGFFSLRVCIYALAFGFYSLAWSIILVNSLDFNGFAIGFILAMITAASMIIIWTTTLYGAITASYSSILMGTIFWSVFTIMWLLIVLISCIENTSVVLINHRGPESVWLLYNMYNRGEFDINYEYYEHVPHERGMCINRLSSSENETSENVANTEFHPRVLMSKTVDNLCMKWLLISISFAIFAYLICGSWYIMYSFCKEINYDITCLCPAKCNLHENV